MDLARSRPRSTVRELYEKTKTLRANLFEEEFVQAVTGLSADGKVNLEDSVPPAATFWSFLATWYLSLWWYGIVALSAITLLAVYLLPNVYPLVAARWVAGSVFVLFLPGYVTLRILFPKRELDDIERFALSIGLSLALVPLIGLILNYTPWGIRLNSIIAALTLYANIIGLLAAWRTFQFLHANATLEF